MKTWKKIEETKKRTGDITHLKKRNEDKVQKVSLFLLNTYLSLLFCVENIRHLTRQRTETIDESKQLHAFKIKVRRKEKSLRRSFTLKEGRGEIS